MRNKMSIRVKLTLGFLILSILILAAGLLGVRSIAQLYKESGEVGVVNAPLGDAAMEIKLTLTTGHLWFEEAVSGDTTVDMDAIWALWDETRWYCDAMLGNYANLQGTTGTGRYGTFITNDEDTFYAVKDPDIVANLQRVRSDLDAFVDSAHIRWEQYSGSATAGSGADQSFDVSYDEIQEDLKDIIDTVPDAAVPAGEARYLLANGHLFFEELLSGDNSNDFQEILGQFEQAIEEVESISDFISLRLSRNLIRNLDTFIQAAHDRYESTVNTSLKGREADQLFDESFEHLIQDADDAETAIKGFMDQGVEQMTQAASAGTKILLSAIGASFILAIAIGLILSASIATPIQKIISILDQGALQISSASAQLSSSSQDIANGATEQASSIEETTSSMEELSSMVRQNAENSRMARSLTEQANANSQEGHLKMKTMLNAMTDINKSSDQIKKVIEVIDNIAFQTNILALNAAVEAARAGEAGMGFAVVADEVKNLANRSAEAAKETADMIENSLRKTEEGLKISSELAETFQGLKESISKSTEMATEIEASSRQQDMGIEQTNKAVIELDKVVQNNAASAEEAASAAEELNSQAASLKEVVSQLVTLVTGKVGSKSTARFSEANTAASFKRTGGRPTALPDSREPRQEVSPESMIPFEDDEDLSDL